MIFCDNVGQRDRPALHLLFFWSWLRFFVTADFLLFTPGLVPGDA